MGFDKKNTVQQPSRRTVFFWKKRGSESRKDLVQLFFGLAQFHLELAHHFLFFAFGKHEVVVGQLGEFLLELAFLFVPVAFDFGRVHKNVIMVFPKTSGRSRDDSHGAKLAVADAKGFTRFCQRIA